MKKQWLHQPSVLCPNCGEAKVFVELADGPSVCSTCWDTHCSRAVCSACGSRGSLSLWCADSIGKELAEQICKANAECVETSLEISSDAAD